MRDALTHAHTHAHTCTHCIYTHMHACTHPYTNTLPQSHKGSKKGKVSRADLEQCRLALETQTHVCETLEHERDQANDDYEFAQVSYM